jgi:hypothetical protein
MLLRSCLPDAQPASALGRQRDRRAHAFVDVEDRNVHNWKRAFDGQRGFLGGFLSRI